MVIGIIAAIGIPSLLKSRLAAQKNMCASNLRQIQAAVQLWAADTRMAPDANFTTADIVPEYMKSWPREGTAYYPVPATIAETPVCPNSATNTDHKL
jgi:type II secretory pathway pseudopilin PulG